MSWIRRGIGRRLDGQASNLSGKPTFLSVLLNDGWVAANDPKKTFKEKLLGDSWCFLAARDTKGWMLWAY